VLFANCWRLFRDKEVRGVSIFAFGYFLTWRLWHLFYYPRIDQPLSFAGTVIPAVANASWVAMAIYFALKARKQGQS
jgi:hypothetical protein